MNITSKQFQGAPLYIRNELERLEANESFWRARALSDTMPSNTWVRHGLDARQYLGDDARVEYQLGIGQFATVEAHMTSHGLYVYSGGGSSLAVMPHASNSVMLKLG